MSRCGIAGCEGDHKPQDHNDRVSHLSARDNPNCTCLVVGRENCNWTTHRAMGPESREQASKVIDDLRRVMDTPFTFDIMRDPDWQPSRADYKIMRTVAEVYEATLFGLDERVRADLREPDKLLCHLMWAKEQTR